VKIGESQGTVFSGLPAELPKILLNVTRKEGVPENGHTLKLILTKLTVSHDTTN
jgi:hypothetical protein